MLSAIIKTVAVLAIAIGSVFLAKEGSPQQAQPPPPVEQPIGASIPIVVSRFETSLQSSISDSATSMTLVSGTDRAGNPLSGFHCFTIDEGTSVVEDVCGTASGTAISSLTRGISPVTGTSSVASLRFVHRRGASVKITDYPHIAVISRIMNGNETLPNRLSYDSTIATGTFTTYNLVNKQYVDGIALQSAPTATTTLPGVVEIATSAEVQSGTGLNGGYTLVPAASLFNQTPSANVIIPVTNSSGKLAQGFLDLTVPFVFTNASSTNLTVNGNTYLATTTFTTAPTAPTTTPTSSSSLVTQYYVDNFPKFASGIATRAGDTSSGSSSIAHGLGRTPRYVKIEAQKIAGTTNHSYSTGIYNGVTTNALFGIAILNFNLSTTTSPILAITDDGTAYQYAAISSVDGTNINLTWTKVGSPSSNNIIFLWEAY